MQKLKMEEIQMAVQKMYDTQEVVIMDITEEELAMIPEDLKPQITTMLNNAQNVINQILDSKNNNQSTQPESTVAIQLPYINSSVDVNNPTTNIQYPISDITVPPTYITTPSNNTTIPITNTQVDTPTTSILLNYPSTQFPVINTPTTIEPLINPTSSIPNTQVAITNTQVFTTNTQLTTEISDTTNSIEPPSGIPTLKRSGSFNIPPFAASNDLLDLIYKPKLQRSSSLSNNPHIPSAPPLSLDDSSEKNSTSLYPDLNIKESEKKRKFSDSQDESDSETEEPLRSKKQRTTPQREDENNSQSETNDKEKDKDNYKDTNTEDKNKEKSSSCLVM